MRTPRILLETSIALLVAATPAVAAATPGFPHDIQVALMLSSPPPCDICHVGTPEEGTATTPFALAMLAHHLEPGVDSSVATALAGMERDDVDSNGDGRSDVEKLEQGDDPNTGLPLAVAPGVIYGCSAQRTPGDATWQGAAALGTALVLGMARRRRVAAR